MLVIAAAPLPRRACVIAVVLIHALFALEDGVHSVHHLNDRIGRAGGVVVA